MRIFCVAFGIASSIICSSTAASQELFSLVHEFNDDGLSGGTLTLGTDGQLYGVTTKSGWGAVFRIDAAGTPHAVHIFTGADGSSPRKALVRGSDGLLYGVTERGGTHNAGTVYRITAAGAVQSLHSFGAAGEAYPSTLAPGSDGFLYGTTAHGGLSNAGMLFRVDTDGTVQLLDSFDAWTHGSSPNLLVPAADGALYGTTTNGGSADWCGTVFRVPAGGGLQRVHGFASSSDGCWPHSLLIASDGAIYGTTRQGGASGNGTAFKIGLDGTFQSLHSFSGGDTAARVFVRGVDGAIYGTTVAGAPIVGSIFRINPDGSVQTLHSFAGGSSPTASSPEASDGLVVGSDGAIYGTTHTTVFRLDADGTLTSLHNFYLADRGLAAGLIVGSDGAVYGTTHEGLVNRFGVVYRVDAAGTVTTLGSFERVSDGQDPQVLIAAADGTLFGTTRAGGAYGYGTVFQVAPDGTFTSLHDFNRANGSEPGTLAIGSDGAVYGTTTLGGDNNRGTIYRLSAGLFTSLHSFDLNTGVFPTTANDLVLAADGALYGTAGQGGAFHAGTLFKITPDGVVHALHHFNYGVDGSASGRLVRGADGLIYGANQGGPGNSGVLFRVGADGSVTVLHTFAGLDGASPSGLVLGADGIIYGTTQQGGAAGFGTVFRMTATGAAESLHSFNGANGSFPGKRLAVGADGAVYGTAWGGGAHGSGVLFRVEAGGAVSSVHHFDPWADGGGPNSVAAGADGAIYGTAETAGPNGYGTIFRLSGNGPLQAVHGFGEIDGAFPRAVIASPDGAIYGITPFGGRTNSGVVFRFAWPSCGPPTVDAGANQILMAGASGLAPFSFIANGTSDCGPLQYQWFESGSFVSNGPVLADSAGIGVRTFTVIATDIIGQTASDDVQLTVQPLGGRIAVTVVLETAGPRTPRPGITVEVFDATATLVATGSTDGDGVFLSAVLPPGGYFVRTAGSEFVDELHSEIACDNGCDVTRGSTVTVSSGSMETIDISLAFPGEIAGVVRDAVAMTPLGGIEVSVYSEAGENIASVTTAPDGQFSVPGLVQGDYFARTTNAGSQDFVDELFDNISCLTGCGVNHGTPISVTAGFTNNVDFSLLPATGGIAGVVTDADTLTPLNGVMVTVFDGTGADVVSALTNEAGQYLTPDIPTGDYFVRTTDIGGFVGELFNDIPCATGCNVTSGQVVTHAAGSTGGFADFALARGSFISGNASGAAGAGGVRVDIYDSSGTFVTSATPDSTGTYATVTLPVAEYFARTGNTAGYADLLYDAIDCAVGCDVTTGTVISLTAGVEASSIDFGLGPNTIVGSDITVTPEAVPGYAPAEITFPVVTTEGRTTVSVSSSGPPIPSGFQLGDPPIYYEVSTTASFVPPATTCFNYTGVSYTDESALQLLHFQFGMWTNVTTSHDPANDVICGSVRSFSPFVVAEQADATPPALSCSVNPAMVWPPNNKLIPVRASVLVTDGESGPGGFVLESITSSEPGSGDIVGFATGTPDLEGQVRATRRGNGPGRVYTLRYAGRDLAGNVGTCIVTVTVPHDQDKR